MAEQFYHDTENAQAYAEMCEGYDASVQLKILDAVLEQGSSILELGSGPGNDFALLIRRYEATASDYSPAFLSMLADRFPHHPAKMIDVRTPEMDQTFDAVYSNKVLHHLTHVELAQSFAYQSRLLKPGGFAFHLIWQELEAPEDGFGMTWQARNAPDMEAAMEPHFETVKIVEFGEFKDGDSLAVLARKR